MGDKRRSKRIKKVNHKKPPQPKNTSQSNVV